MTNIVAILQARTSSSRLPGKVLKRLGGHLMFVYQARRVLKSKKITRLVVATSDQQTDDAIEEACKIENLSCFRGSLDNVLSRFYGAACQYQADTIVRLTADCPLIDPNIIDACIDKLVTEKLDYVSNCVTRTYADGMDVEVFTLSALNKAFKLSMLKSEREHVTSYIWKRPEVFLLGNIVDIEDQSSLRLTVDYEEDFQLIEKIVHHFNDIGNKNFSYEDIKHYFYNNPEVANVNKQYSCNEGYAKSVANDEAKS